MMRKLVLLAAVISSFALIAVAAQGQGNPNCPAGTSDPAYCSSPPPSPKAPGYYCNKQHASKKHVKGQKGTEFSRCVKALNDLRKHDSQTAKKACTKAKAPKTKVKGSHKTGYQKCVAAGKALRADQ